jgi:hypothetical protein
VKQFEKYFDGGRAAVVAQYKLGDEMLDSVSGLVSETVSDEEGMVNFSSDGSVEKSDAMEGL